MLNMNLLIKKQVTPSNKILKLRKQSLVYNKEKPIAGAVHYFSYFLNIIFL